MSKNDITGDDLKSKASTDAYREGHDRIFQSWCTLCGKASTCTCDKPVDAAVNKPLDCQKSPTDSE